MIVCDIAPGANVTVPDGRTPPAKSSALAVPAATAKSAMLLPAMLPVRVWVKVKSALPRSPSSRLGALEMTSCGTATGVISTSRSAKRSISTPIVVSVPSKPFVPPFASSTVAVPSVMVMS